MPERLESVVISHAAEDVVTEVSPSSEAGVSANFTREIIRYAIGAGGDSVPAEVHT